MDKKTENEFRAFIRKVLIEEKLISPKEADKKKKEGEIISPKKDNRKNEGLIPKKKDDRINKGLINP